MRRVALFIGVDEYQDSMINDLNCAVSDAQITAGIFQKRGFEIHRLTNHEANKCVVAAKVNELCKTLDNGDMFVFYFAGHGNETNDAHSLIFSSANTDPFDLTNGEDSIPLSVFRKCNNLREVIAGKNTVIPEDALPVLCKVTRI